MLTRTLIGTGEFDRPFDLIPDACVLVDNCSLEIGRSADRSIRVSFIISARIWWKRILVLPPCGLSVSVQPHRVARLQEIAADVVVRVHRLAPARSMHLQRIR